MKTSRILVVMGLVAAGAAGVWSFMRPTSVELVAPRRGDAAEIVYATGVVEPRTWAKVTPLIREHIVELCNCEGQDVEEGAVLARLDSRQADATLAELRARERLAATEYERLSVLIERNAASQQALDRARSEINQAEALISGHKARLENYVLRAPMSGVVLRQDGEVGEIAEPGTVLFWVGKPKPLQVVADVNEEDIPRIAVGQRVLLQADAFSGRQLEASVDRITPKGDPVAKTYRVYLALPDDTPLMIGMTVEINIVIRVADNALLVPAEAIRENAVFTVADGVARRHPVTIGIRGPREVEVLSGLDDDQRIISPVPETLVDGAKVRPAEQ